MSTVRVRYWAGAQRAAGRADETLAVASVGELRTLLALRPELAALAAVATFLVDERRADESAALQDGATVDLLPPFAGG